jgi:hypothetical protein
VGLARAAHHPPPGLHRTLTPGGVSQTAIGYRGVLLECKHNFASLNNVTRTVAIIVRGGCERRRNCVARGGGAFPRPAAASAAAVGGRRNSNNQQQQQQRELSKR